MFTVKKKGDKLVQKNTNMQINHEYSLQFNTCNYNLSHVFCGSLPRLNVLIKLTLVIHTFLAVGNISDKTLNFNWLR